MNTILQINASSRIDTSLSRQVGDYISQQLLTDSAHQAITRDLATQELPFVSEQHIGAYYTPADQRSDEQQALLDLSDEMIAELKSATHLVIATPMYNFSVPAALKAWIDLVCRVGETFVYEATGPKGLLNIKEAFIVVTAGGTPIGSPVDFTSGYLQQVCRFMGIENSHIIDVSGSKREPDTLLDFGKQQVDTLLLDKAA